MRLMRFYRRSQHAAREWRSREKVALCDLPARFGSSIIRPLQPRKNFLEGYMVVSVSVTVNGQRRKDEIEPRLLLVHYLRDRLGLTGTKVACDTSQFGVCPVIVSVFGDTSSRGIA